MGYPDRMRALFEALDLTRPGLEKTAAAIQHNDPPGACRALLAYYRGGDSASWVRAEPVAPGTENDDEADALLADRFTFYRQLSVIPRLPDGRLDWNHRGPENDMEWAWALNRHQHLGTLLKAYRAHRPGPGTSRGSTGIFGTG